MQLYIFLKGYTLLVNADMDTDEAFFILKSFAARIWTVKLQILVQARKTKTI